MKDLETLTVTKEDITSSFNDDYKLTPAEERLALVLLDPDYLGKTIAEKCRVAEVCRDFYYKAMKKPDFVNYMNRVSVDHVRDKIGEILQASAKVAINSGARGYQDRRMLLELFGLEIKQGDDIKIQIVNLGPSQNEE